MPGKILIQSSLLPLEAVSLGRFVVDINHPQRRYHDPFPGKILGSTVQVEKDVTEMVQRLQSTRARVSLTELLTFFRSKHERQAIQVRAVMAGRYILSQWDSIFCSACALEGTRRWLEDAIEDGKEIYFTVGYCTFVNPAAVEEARSGKGIEQSVQLPVSIVADANLAGIQLGGVADPAMSHGKEKDTLAARSYSMSGEYVYAVQYCKVSFKWFSTRNVESSLLGKNKWRVYIGVRGEEEDWDGKTDDNTVEAELVKDWQSEDTTVVECY
ncbi:uncharacterized protein TrAFT101_007394 [Trichoderma asperellum]|uniref:uncharacterized protein n=1 Tax=Trichoderma asperellum TaxID=101201 RepID=UPI0033335830|nr:hypothetical protein TrAFT101_007394 [Trichoderma asperellum]